jgi:hypothetical protein
MYDNITGFRNSAFGLNALRNNTTGNNNTAIGYNTGGGITTGINNTIIGANVIGLAAAISNNIILANGAGSIKAQFNGVSEWKFTGGLIASGSLTAGGNVVAGGTQDIAWSARSAMSSPSNGIIGLYNANHTDFSRLQFGGTTSSFPALKRSGAGLQVRTADDAGYSTIAASGLTITSVPTTSTGTYDILTRNTTTGGVEKILSTFSTDSTVVHLAGTETITGPKTFTNITNLGSGIKLLRRAISDAAATISTSDYLVAFTSLSATRAVTLPSASSAAGQHFVIKDESGMAGSFAITILGTVDGTINPVAINAQYGKYKIYSNGTGWFTE